MVSRLRATLMLVAAIVVANCTSRVGTLAIGVTRSSERNNEPLQGQAAYVRVRVDGPDLRVGPVKAYFDTHSAVLEEIPVGEGRLITVEGLGGEENIVSHGRSGPFTVRPGNNQLDIFIGLVGKFSIGPGPMNQQRAFHTATLLGDGSLLLAGGTEDPWRPESRMQPPSALASTERIDGNSLLVEARASRCLQPGAAGCMWSKRIGHSATLLKSGNVLLALGSNGTLAATSVETYQPDQRLFLRVSDTNVLPQIWHQAAPYERGVAFLGGVDYSGGVVRTGQLYEPGAVRPAVPALNTPRRAFSLTVLQDGRLFVAGGFDAKDEPLSSTELLGQGSPNWIYGPKLTIARAYHSDTLLADGTVLLAGGLGLDNAIPTVERYDPRKGATGQVRPMDDTIQARWGHTASLLSDGRVLVVGGFAGNVNSAPTNSVEALKVLGETELQVLRIAGGLREGRAGHTATVMRSGLLVVAGGTDGTSVVFDTLEIFVYLPEPS